jgi:preprotein translocase subunit SecG
LRYHTVGGSLTEEEFLMIYFLYGLHILLSFALVIVVLMQSGKGGGISGAFGGSFASSSLLGTRATNMFLTRATTVLAIAFMVSCLVLVFVGMTASTGKATTSTSTEKTAVEKAKEAAAGQPQPPAGQAPQQGQGQPGQVQVQPGQGQPMQGQPVQVKPGQSVPVQMQPGQSTPPPQKPAPAKPFGQ